VFQILVSDEKPKHLWLKVVDSSLVVNQRQNRVLCVVDDSSNSPGLQLCTEDIPSRKITCAAVYWKSYLASKNVWRMDDANLELLLSPNTDTSTFQMFRSKGVEFSYFRDRKNSAGWLTTRLYFEYI